MSAERRALSIEPGRKVDFLPIERDPNSQAIINLTDTELLIGATFKQMYQRKGQNAGIDTMAFLKRYQSSIRPELFEVYAGKVIEHCVLEGRFAEAEQVAKRAGKGFASVLNMYLSRHAEQVFLSSKN